MLFPWTCRPPPPDHRRMPVPDRRPVLHWTADVSTFFQGVFRRKAAVIVLVVAALGLGVFRFSTMPMEFLPEMENPEVTVSVIGPGYDAASMEKLVTNPLENSLAAVKGKPTCFPCPETDFRKSICSSIPGRTWMQEARSFPDGAGRNGLGQHVDGQQRGRSPLRLGSIADARQLHGSIDRGNRRGSGGRSRVVHNEERMTIREALLEAAGTRMRPDPHDGDGDRRRDGPACLRLHGNRQRRLAEPGHRRDRRLDRRHTADARICALRL